MPRGERYHDFSLHPPTHPPRPRSGAGDALPWVLLDNTAYIADVNPNHTTAHSHTRDGDEIQVSFFLAEPPVVSHCCFSRTRTKDPTVFGREPSIVAAEADLVLFFCVHGSPSNYGICDKQDYYVYQAGGGGGRPPSLKLLPHPQPDVFPYGRSYYFHNRQAGLLRYSSTKHEDDGGASRFILRRHGASIYDQYIIAALCTDIQGRFLLCTYDSKTETWNRQLALLDDQLQKIPKISVGCDRVITIDEDVGTMGWVDLWRGIVVCDVLPLEKEAPVPLRYIRLPPSIRGNKPPRSFVSMFRDIAVVRGRIMYAEVQMQVRPVSYKPGSFISDGWTAVTWSRSTANSLEEDWHEEFKVHSHEISIDDDNGAAGFELLPKLVDDKGTPQPTLERIHIGHPKLSYGDDDIVYFTVKVDHRDPEAWVITIDMRNKMLRGVAKFGGAPRVLSLGDTYTRSCISGYLNNTALDMKNHLKRPGMPLQGCSHKKVIQTPVMDYLGAMGFHVEGDSMGVDDKGDDAMDFD